MAIELQQDLGPLFNEVRQRHNISLNMIIEDLLIADVDKQIAFTVDSLQLFDLLNIGREEVVDAMIASLARLSGEPYTRKDIGYIAFLPPT